MSELSPTLRSKKLIQELRAQGRKVYNFGLGENPMPPSPQFVKLVQEYASEKGYASCEGVPTLNRALKGIYDTAETQYGIVVGNGLKELLFVIQTAFKGKIIHITPSWVSYREHIEILQREEDLIELRTTIDQSYKIKPEQLEECLQNTQYTPVLLIFNNPNNPTGISYTNSELRDISNVIGKYANVAVLADEIYANLCHNGDVVSISKYLPKQTIRGSSVSKDLSCGGYRVGWMAFPDTLDTLFRKCCNYASRIYSCASVPVQHATGAILCNKRLCQELFNSQAKHFGQITETLLAQLKDTELQWVKPDAAWYVFLCFDNYRDQLYNQGIKDSVTLATHLLKQHGISTIAGKYFDMESTSLTLRFAFVDFPEDQNKIAHMKEGLDMLKEFLRKLS